MAIYYLFLHAYFYCSSNSASSVKSFDAWGFVEHSLIESAVSKVRFKATSMRWSYLCASYKFKAFDAWGWLSGFVDWAAASKARFAGALLSVELVRKNRQTSRVLTLGVSLSNFCLRLQRQKDARTNITHWHQSQRYTCVNALDAWDVPSVFFQ